MDYILYIYPWRIFEQKNLCKKLNIIAIICKCVKYLSPFHYSKICKNLSQNIAYKQSFKNFIQLMIYNSSKGNDIHFNI